MSAPELKPCPFCGGEAVPVCVYHPNGYAFGCPKCSAKGPTYKASSASEVTHEAIAVWNCRAPSNSQADALAEMAELIADIEESLTADGTYRLLREACRKMLTKIGEQP